jgi:general stress protein 26
MAFPAPIIELDRRFSSDGASPPPWWDVVAALERAEIFWLSTVRADGRPHVTPLPAVWHDGALHFCTGPQEQKARNLAAEDRCVLTTGVPTQSAGLDVVVEGRARRVEDPDRLAELAARWKAELDWDFEVKDGAFAQRSGPADDAGDEGGAAGGDQLAHVFAVVPTKVLAFGKGEPFSQTRYSFPTR